MPDLSHASECHCDARTATDRPRCPRRRHGEAAHSVAGHPGGRGDRGRLPRRRGRGAVGGASAGAGHRLREAAGAVGVGCRGAVDPGPGGPAAGHRRRRPPERHPRRGAGGGLVRTGPADGRALRGSRRELGPRRGRLGGRGGADLVVAGVAASGTGAAADRRAAGRLGRSSPPGAAPRPGRR